MQQRSSEKPPLSSDAAFVIQLRSEAPITPSGIEGRIEHVRSGRATRFHSVDELLAFVASVMNRRACPGE